MIDIRQSLCALVGAALCAFAAPAIADFGDYFRLAVPPSTSGGPQANFTITITNKAAFDYLKSFTITAPAGVTISNVQSASSYIPASKISATSTGISVSGIAIPYGQSGAVKMTATFPAAACSDTAYTWRDGQGWPHRKQRSIHAGCRTLHDSHDRPEGLLHGYAVVERQREHQPVGCAVGASERHGPVHADAKRVVLRGHGHRNLWRDAGGQRVYHCGGDGQLHGDCEFRAQRVVDHVRADERRRQRAVYGGCRHEPRGANGIDEFGLRGDFNIDLVRKLDHVLGNNRDGPAVAEYL